MNTNHVVRFVMQNLRYGHFPSLRIHGVVLWIFPGGKMAPPIKSFLVKSVFHAALLFLFSHF